MFKLNDIIPALPETTGTQKNQEACGGKAKVVYIHPLGRYYTLEFTFADDSFRESRFFTEAEKEAGERNGTFRKIRKDVQRRKSEQRKRATGCPPGYIMEDFDFDEDGTDPFISYMGDGQSQTRQQQQRSDSDVDAALLF